MKRLQVMAVIACVLAFLACIGALAILRQRNRLWENVSDLDQLVALSEKLGGTDALEQRLHQLLRRRSVAKARLSAASQGTEPFTRRIQELLNDLDLRLLSTTGWELPPVPKASNEAPLLGEPPPGVTYSERTFEVEGSMGAVLDAIHSVESWPDRARLRLAVIIPAGVERIRASLRLSLATGVPEPPQPKGKDAPNAKEKS